MLKVIGLGYPRTGTMSLKHALEELGYGPCYHMIEVFEHPAHEAFWTAAFRADGRHTDWDEVFAGYGSSTDCPGCCFWEQLAEHYSDSRLILTVRDSDAWYESFRNTVYQAMTGNNAVHDQAHRRVQQMANSLILDGMFSGRFDDRDFAISCYENHNAQVRRTFSASRLLVMNVSEGWRPLCDFLDCPVPATEFPHANRRTEFQQRFAVNRSEHHPD